MPDLAPHVLALRRLAETLPRGFDNRDVSEQARGALGILACEAIAASTGTGDAWVANPQTCPNCGTIATSNRTPYCSECCKQEAAFVRQVRHGLANGSIADRERQVAFGQKFWHLLGGGYPLRQSLVLERTRKKVFERTRGLCERCGAPAVAVDHISSG